MGSSHRFPATQALLNRRRHLRDADALETPRRLMTLALVRTVAAIEPRHRHVSRRPGPVALRIGRAEERHDRRADGGGDVQRTGVARHHERGLARERDEIGHLGGRGGARRTTRGGDDRLRERQLPWSPQHDRRQAAHLAEKRRHLAEARRRPPLVGPGRAGIDERERTGPDLAPDALERARGHVGDRELDPRRLDAHDAQQVEILLDHMSGVIAATSSVSE